MDAFYVALRKSYRQIDNLESLFGYSVDEVVAADRFSLNSVPDSNRDDKSLLDRYLNFRMIESFPWSSPNERTAGAMTISVPPSLAGRDLLPKKRCGNLFGR